MEIEIEKNVLGFIDECAKEIGRFADNDWSAQLWGQCRDKKIESPIEQLFFCAFETVKRFNYIGDWMDIIPQFKVDNYRVDFLVYSNDGPEKRRVIVECDSQEFHERTETERRYEKKRDRHLVSNGFRVFRFTGKEIKDDPLRVAGEAIAYLEHQSIDNILLNSNVGSV